MNVELVKQKVTKALGIKPEQPASMLEKPKPIPVPSKSFRNYDDDPSDVPADIDMILASTEKLLAVNRGLADPDERDSLAFKTIKGPDKLLEERIALDAGKLRLSAARRLARQRSLKAITPDYFGGYAEGLLIGNALSSPLEEINPMHIVEQSRRITAMGPGGLPSSDSITSEAQALHPSSFGFIDIIAGPESERAGVDVRAAMGTKLGSDGKIYQRFKDRKNGVVRWLSPSDLDGKVLGLPE